MFDTSTGLFFTPAGQIVLDVLTGPMS